MQLFKCVKSEENRKVGSIIHLGVTQMPRAKKVLLMFLSRYLFKKRMHSKAIRNGNLLLCFDIC